jgi:UDP-N-acetyl-D-glucosamine dehydrogenase
MPQRVVDRAIAALSERAGRAIKGARVLLIGVGYKKNVEDTRESPALTIMEDLERRGAVVSFHDPLLAELPATREHPQLAGRRSTPLTAAALAAFDIAIICADHDAVDYRLLVNHCPLIVDTRNICARLGLGGDRVIKA